MYSRKELEGRGFGPHEVWVVDHHFLTLKDGVRIAAKIWMPFQVKDMLREELDQKWLRKYCDQDGSAPEVSGLNVRPRILYERLVL